MKEALLVLAGIVAAGCYIPYAIDILAGKAKPARSARVMFVLLLTITLLQQISLHSGALIVVTACELVGSVAILAISLKQGAGGLARLDLICYGLLVIDLAIWLATGSTFIALHLSVLADLIAFTPTLVKTWKHPKSETPFFFFAGAVAPLLNILGSSKFSYAVLLFPVYLILANFLEVLIIVIKGKKALLSTGKPTEPVV